MQLSIEDLLIPIEDLLLGAQLAAAVRADDAAGIAQHSEMLGPEATASLVERAHQRHAAAQSLKANQF